MTVIFLSNCKQLIVNEVDVIKLGHGPGGQTNFGRRAGNTQAIILDANDLFQNVFSWFRVSSLVAHQRRCNFSPQ